MATLERLYQYNVSSERELDAGELDNSSRLDAGAMCVLPQPASAYNIVNGLGLELGSGLR